jgi:ABC-type multidrug transport system ATPase subunit
MPTTAVRQWRDPAIVNQPPAAASRDDSPNTIPILQHVNGHVASGSLFGVMGASGAGKTCLLDILAGRHKLGDVNGTILVNGRPRAHDFTQMAGYVMQDDALITNLTVRETLYYSLALRIPPSSMTDGERASRIQSILDVLGLTSIADNRIGDALKRGISGGERRRVSIGVELVTSPSILFVDEPTSGLDASNSLRVMKALRALCLTGRTVICTIHQPRSNVFQMFDQLLLLAQGEVVYCGPTIESMNYFKQLGYACPAFINPADYYLDVLEGKEDESQSSWQLDSNGVSTIVSTPLPSVTSIENGHDDDDEDEKTVSGSVLAARVDNLIISYYKSNERGTITKELDKLMFAQSNVAIAMRPSSRLIFSCSQFRPAVMIQLQSVIYVGVNMVSSSNTYSITWWQQLRVLSSRLWTATIRDSSIMYVRTAAALGIGIYHIPANRLPSKIGFSCRKLFDCLNRFIGWWYLLWPT